MNSDIRKSRGEKIVEFILSAHRYIGIWALGMWITYAHLGDRLEDARTTIFSIAALAIMLGIMTMIFTKWAAEFIRRVRR